MFCRKKEPTFQITFRLWKKPFFDTKLTLSSFDFQSRKKMLFWVWKIMLPKASSHQVSMIGSLVVVNRMLLLSVGRITNDPDTSKLNSVMPRVWNKNSKSTRESLGWVKLFQKNSSEKRNILKDSSTRFNFETHIWYKVESMLHQSYQGWNISYDSPVLVFVEFQAEFLKLHFLSRRTADLKSKASTTFLGNSNICKHSANFVPVEGPHVGIL